MLDNEYPADVLRIAQNTWVDIIDRNGPVTAEAAIELIAAAILDGRRGLVGMLQTLCNGIEWNIENHPTVMNESDSEALAEARAMIAELEPTQC
jgi:hypothetical protein